MRQKSEGLKEYESFHTRLGEWRAKRMAEILEDLDRSEKADASRFRWIIDGNGYAMEEWGVRGGASEEDQDYCRCLIELWRGPQFEGE